VISAITKSYQWPDFFVIPQYHITTLADLVSSAMYSIF
jgi:hypothetical protein